MERYKNVPASVVARRNAESSHSSVAKRIVPSILFCRATASRYSSDVTRQSLCFRSVYSSIST